MMSDSNGRERGQERELKNESWVILLIVGMIMLCLMGVIALLVFPQTHMTLQAKCSPLDDPKIENNTRKGTVYRASVPVEVISDRSGYGASILKHKAIVYNSVKGEWTNDYQAELNFSMKHCLCAGCTGIEPGICEGCIPRTPGCDVDPPEFDCWMDASNPAVTFPTYSIHIHHVRFEKAFVQDYSVWWKAMTIFLVLGGLFIVLAMILYLPSIVRGDGNGQYKPLD